MTITHTPVDTSIITEGPAPTTSPRPAGTGPRRGRGALTWGLVAGASIAAVVLAVNVFDNDGGRSDRTSILNAGPVGDAKDHVNYGSVIASQATTEGLGDAKDHVNYGPVSGGDT